MSEKLPLGSTPLDPPTLAYESRVRRPDPVREAPLILYILRRITFAVGVWLLLVGMGMYLTSPSSDAPYFMGFGGGLIALCVPLGRLPPHLAGGR